MTEAQLFKARYQDILEEFHTSISTMEDIHDYEALLAHGRARLLQYKSIRSKFAENVTCICVGEHNHASLQASKCESCALDGKYDTDTGIENHLTGKYLDQILQLNDFIYTTASTNYPADSSFQQVAGPNSGLQAGLQVQSMFVDFYAPQSLCMTLCTHLHSKRLTYFIYDEKAEKVVGANREVADTSLLGGEAINQFPDNLLPAFGCLFAQDDPLVYMTVEDPKQDCRTLYEEVLAACKQSA
jgi:hypothetical protein